MKKIRINAKSTPEIGELLPKIDAGFRNIEIQLIHKFLSKNEYVETELAIKEYGVDISVVHSPLIPKSADANSFEIALNHLLLFGTEEVLEDTIKYAEFVAQIENHRVKVVIHNDFSKELCIQTALIKEKIGPMLQRILNKYEHVDLVIENGSCFDNDRFRTIANMEDVAYAVKELNEFIPNRVHPLIDTCHILMSWEAWKRFTYEDLTDWDREFGLATMYHKLGLIHLNNIRDNGIDTDHGMPFDFNLEDDNLKLKKIMDAYEKYASCEITIEVRENDYFSTPYNLISTRESLEKMGYELDLG